ncbi:MAG TPA: hydroxyacid dehydrogenase [Candidatus Eubacterium pullicola]|nr:hydroxyacid dehydrogenase [Candidatus Eubacterium pullicola]
MKIVFLEPLGISEELLKEKISYVIDETKHEIIYYKDRQEDTDTLIERSRDADIVVLSNFKYGKDVMESCPSLKMVCVAFTGVDHVDIDYCREKGITVCNCAGYSTSAVADIVFAMVISLARNIIPCQDKARNGGTKDGLVGFELDGKTFGIIGTGAIGTRVAKIANAFGCKVIAYSRTKKDLPDVEFVTMEELLKNSDIVSLHVPQTPETTGLIGKEQLELMKPEAILVNTSRGPVVDSAALAAALKNGTIAAAGVDVFNCEPPLPAEEPLLAAPNTLLTPHIAFASHQAFEKRADIVAENIKCWLEGNPQNVII